MASQQPVPSNKVPATINYSSDRLVSEQQLRNRSKPADSGECCCDGHEHHQHKAQKQHHRYGCPLCSLFMNPFPASGNSDDYEPTKLEEAVNVATHTIPIIFFLYFTHQMFEEDVVNSGAELFVAITYCVGMVILFGVSSTYHFVALLYGKHHDKTSFFRSLDYATIYVFIGASYTPWLALVPFGDYGWLGHLMTFIVWSIAFTGLVKSFRKQFLTQISSVLLLNLMGWIAIVMLPPALFTHVPIEAFIFLALGGVFYSGGCFLLNYGDGRIPFAHGMWHMMVNVGVMCHFLVMYEYLMNLDAHFKPGKEHTLMVYQQIAHAYNQSRNWHFPDIASMFTFRPTFFNSWTPQ